ncbi:MAG: D-2-hydroxyacid dehydrogenase [Thermoguttaceae bacterium]|nr:D-2-hydroxyacid dehydrogenase [Thermoguttaceae bacterium]
MKIVVLDGYTLNPGDLSWDELKRMGTTVIYDRTSPEELSERILDAEIVLTNKVVLSAETIAGASRLKYIGILATGVNVVDLQAARDRRIPVTNIPAYSTESVVQFTWAHLLNLVSGIVHNANSVQRGEWCSSPDFSYTRTPLTELAGKTLGIIGLGTIGRRVAEIAVAFGMNVLAYGPHLKVGDSLGKVRFVELETIFRESDVVSLHCPLKADNKGMVNAARLAMMKPGSFLINTARGPLLDETAVAEALNCGRLGGLGADVLSTEPPKADNPLLKAKNVFLTPHNAWATLDARKRLMAILLENILAFLGGTPRNVVN